MTDKAAILAEIKALALHYPRRQMAQADFSRWLDDYVSDLAAAGFSESDVTIACANWRTSEEKQMATPGELLAYCRKVFRPEQVSQPVARIPKRTPIGFEERAKVRQALLELAETLRGFGGMDFNRLARRPGETSAEQAQRLWPNRRVEARRLDEVI